jgi:hypothetical protein
MSDAPRNLFSDAAPLDALRNLPEAERFSQYFAEVLSSG